MAELHVVVPYDQSNSTVRTRALHWIERFEHSNSDSQHSVVVHGPGFGGCSIPKGSDVLLLRNIRRLTRGRGEQRLFKDARLAVYDLDDGLPWDDGRLPGLGRWWKRPFPLSLVARRAASAADRLIVGNDVLAEWGSQYCDDVRIVPTCIEPTEYETRSSWDLEGRVPVIGWIGSSATEPYLDEVAAALAIVHRRTGARVHMISGDGPIPDSLAAFTQKTRWHPESVKTIAEWDLGIMPLRDGVYERAKCGYKLLQYAASGVPAVASPVGVNRQLLTEMDGLDAVSHDDWVEALCGLISEAPERRHQRARSGLVVANRYSYDTWEDTWIEAIGW